MLLAGKRVTGFRARIGPIPLSGAGFWPPPRAASPGLPPPRAGTRGAGEAPLPQRGDVGLRPPAQLLGLRRPMEEKKGQGLRRPDLGAARPGAACAGAHLPQREEVVPPPAEAEAQQLVAQRLREGRARQESGDDAVPERGRLHRRRLCKGQGGGGEGGARAGPGEGAAPRRAVPWRSGSPPPQAAAARSRSAASLRAPQRAARASRFPRFSPAAAAASTRRLAPMARAPPPATALRLPPAPALRRAGQSGRGGGRGAAAELQ